MLVPTQRPRVPLSSTPSTRPHAHRRQPSRPQNDNSSNGIFKMKRGIVRSASSSPSSGLRTGLRRRPGNDGVNFRRGFHKRRGALAIKTAAFTRGPNAADRLIRRLGEAHVDVAHESRAAAAWDALVLVDAILQNRFLGERLGLAVVPRRAERVRDVVGEA